MQQKRFRNGGEGLLKRLLILLTLSIFIWGVVAILGRGSSSDQYIGKVTVKVGTDSYPISGHIVSKVYKEDKTEYPAQELRKIAVSLPVVKSNPETGNKISSMNVSFIKDYTGEITYTIFDKGFNVVVESQPKLEIPVDKGDFFYVKIDIKWGKIKNYTAMEYYFAIQLDETDGA